MRTHSSSSASRRDSPAAAHVTFDEGLGNGTDAGVGGPELDDVLSRLAALDPRAVQMVEMRVFGGLTVEVGSRHLRRHSDWARRVERTPGRRLA